MVIRGGSSSQELSGPLFHPPTTTRPAFGAQHATCNACPIAPQACASVQARRSPRVTAQRMSGLWVREAQGICCVMISHSTWGWGGMWGDGIWWLVDVRVGGVGGQSRGV